MTEHYELAEDEAIAEWDREFAAQTGKYIWPDGTLHDAPQPTPHFDAELLGRLQASAGQQSSMQAMFAQQTLARQHSMLGGFGDAIGGGLGGLLGNRLRGR